MVLKISYLVLPGPADFKSQGISSCGIDLACLGYSIAFVARVKLSFE